ncbi:hypothetical protein PPERSA_11801 [Pseudocohnilembus persalinus]|uniref:Uncharacterized protein n=1 Tax=Pseudocohnilembus persalinus TaxID=266149 RepID=A0A0V0QR40_PSEPJ|nr:hypothetical protein PPERSA_11801 [Pseudocohnilembus persalinus]|eukprot:KRX04745.1 hypothetical protein PPERSA_11801 [Pseudocohnilembus persalinus]
MQMQNEQQKEKEYIKKRLQLLEDIMKKDNFLSQDEKQDFQDKISKQNLQNQKQLEDFLNKGLSEQQNVVFKKFRQKILNELSKEFNSEVKKFIEDEQNFQVLNNHRCRAPLPKKIFFVLGIFQGGIQNSNFQYPPRKNFQGENFDKEIRFIMESNCFQLKDKKIIDNLLKQDQQFLYNNVHKSLQIQQNQEESFKIYFYKIIKPLMESLDQFMSQENRKTAEFLHINDKHIFNKLGQQNLEQERNTQLQQQSYQQQILQQQKSKKQQQKIQDIEKKTVQNKNQSAQKEQKINNDIKSQFFKELNPDLRKKMEQQTFINLQQLTENLIKVDSQQSLNLFKSQAKDIPDQVANISLQIGESFKKYMFNVLGQIVKRNKIVSQKKDESAIFAKKNYNYIINQKKNPYFSCFDQQLEPQYILQTIEEQNYQKNQRSRQKQEGCEIKAKKYLDDNQFVLNKFFKNVDVQINKNFLQKRNSNFVNDIFSQIENQSVRHNINNLYLKRNLLNQKFFNTIQAYNEQKQDDFNIINNKINPMLDLANNQSQDELDYQNNDIQFKRNNQVKTCQKYQRKLEENQKKQMLDLIEGYIFSNQNNLQNQQLDHQFKPNKDEIDPSYFSEQQNLENIQKGFINYDNLFYIDYEGILDFCEENCNINQMYYQLIQKWRNQVIQN